jgi:ribonuclease E
MLVRVLPHQTQVVVLEGPVLVEHHVARSDRTSVVGNVYLGRVRNVLPGMEAAFVDFGEAKNGVLYAGDIQHDPTKHGKRRPRIEEALNKGDEVLVQVVKDAMGEKGARLTNQISLPGRYLVLVPNSDVQGISRRLPDEDRQRLRDIIRDAKPEGYGVIVRTAAAAASKGEIRSDIERLTRIWDQIKSSGNGGNSPRVVYQEPALLLRVLREHYTPEFRRLMIDDAESYEAVIEYLKDIDPDLIKTVTLYEDELPLFERFHVEDQLRKALDRKVWLPSGGHLVIDRTEALTVIDVNTGKFVGSSSLEETVLQNNLEAAEEIGRQLRLRDIGGIIVIDFIDMETETNQRALLRKLRETLARDKTRTQVFDVSNLGLVEMTRKNVSEGLLETFSDMCPTCNGRGVLLHEEAATQGILVEDI